MSRLKSFEVATLETFTRCIGFRGDAEIGHGALGMGHWALKQFWILRKVGAPASGDLNFSRRILDFRFRLESTHRKSKI